MVVAESRDLAAHAASLVRVDYTVLPAVTSIDAALAPDAQLVQHSDLRPGDPLAQTNILKERHFGCGDVGAAQADLLIENTYTFPTFTHFAIEPHGFAVDGRDAGTKIWSPVRHTFLLQKIMADLFELPLGAVKVIAPDPGGGFCGKQNPKFEPLMALVSRRVGAPCRLVLTLEETFQAVCWAGAKMTVRSGFSAAGDKVFHDIRSDYLIGAYVDIAERVMTKGNDLACGPYRVPDARIQARAVLSNTTPSCAHRGFGTPQINWAVESEINEAARRLGLDGSQIRLRNVAD